jgi:hypothetical protein
MHGQRWAESSVAESTTVVTLRAKRKEILRALAEYEALIKKLQFDLVHINSTLALFQTDEAGAEVRMPVMTARLFRYGEMFKMCQEALSKAPNGLDTRELAEIIMQAKGMNPNDRVLRRAITMSIVNILGSRAKRGQIVAAGKRNLIRIWRFSA